MAALSVLLFISGCASNPKSMTDQELRNCADNSFSTNNRINCTSELIRRANPVKINTNTYRPEPPVHNTNYVNQNTGSDWISIDKDFAFRREYTNDTTFTAWVKVKNTGKGYYLAMSKWTVNCKFKQLQIGETIFYDKSGRVVDSIQEPTPFNSIAPETNGEAFYYSVCL